jgi:hypothetical protein
MSTGADRYRKHVAAAIERLGYIKPEYADALSELIAQNEDAHPHQIARLFRKSGTQLQKDTKRALGIRANAEMSREAAGALTQRGLSSPLKGLDATLLAAVFSCLREQTAQRHPATGHCRLEAGPTFLDCAGCQRLNGQPVSQELKDGTPPPDCEKEACSLTFQWRIDFLAAAVEKYRTRTGD